MNFFDKILSGFGYGRSGISGVRYMEYTGDANIPAFSIDLRSFGGIKESYYKCTPVSTIIGKLAAAMANGQWWIVDKKDTDVSNKERKTYGILEKPNPRQSWTELIIQAETFRYLYGEVFFYFSIPVALKPLLNYTPLNYNLIYLIVI